MLLFVDYIATKKIIAPALNTLVGGHSKLYEGSRPLIQGAIGGAAAQGLRPGADVAAERERAQPLDPPLQVANALVRAARGLADLR